jgi:cytoskeletal protein CcmA (bactofilin family)
VSFNGTGDVVLNATISGLNVSKLAVAQNNLIVGDASGQGSLLAPGSNGQVLAIVSGAPAWTNVSAVFTETDPVWTADKAGATTITGTWTFNNTINGSITGNAATATALATARNFSIGGDVTASAVPFNGTGDVVLNATISGLNVSKLAVAQNNLIVGDASGQGSLLAPGSNGQVLTIVSGVPTWANLPAVTETDPVWTADKAGATTITGTWTFNNTINGSITGNAGTATALQNARNFSMSGDVTAPAVSFNGTGDVVLNATISGLNVSKLAVAQNNLIVGDASGQGSLLAPGSNGQVLAIVGGAPAWTNVSSLETDPQVGTLSNGQVAFWDGSALIGNNNLFWDNVNNRLGIGTNAPTAELHVVGAANVTGDANITGNLIVSANATITTSLSVGGNTTLGSPTAPVSTQVFSQNDGGAALSVVNNGTAPALEVENLGTGLAVQVTGGANIAGNLTVTGTINGSITGNAGTATKLATARNFSMSGDVSAPAVSFDGTGDVVLNATISGLNVSKLAVAQNNLIVGDASGQGSLLAPGSNGQVLAIVGGAPTWTNVSAVFTETDPQVGTLSTGQVAFWDGSALIGNNNLFWDNGNNRLGIGTSSPATALDVVGAATISSNTSIGGSLSATGTATIGSGLTVSSGGAAITGNTSTSGDLSAGGNFSVSGTTVSLPSIPSSSTASQVVVWNGGNLERRDVSTLVSSAGWSLTGNSGTNPTTNFLGTTDATDLVFRTNNVEGMRLTSSGDLTLQNNLTVSANATINSDLFVGGNTTLGSLSAPVSTQVFSQNDGGAALSVVNNGTAPALEVENVGTGLAVKVTGDANITGNLIVSANATINSDLFVGGNTTLGSLSAPVSTQVFSQNDGGAALSVVNDGTAPALEVANTGGGLAISITDDGGGVKVSHGTVSVSGNAATVQSNVTAVQITSDNNGTNDNITLPNSAVNGTILYVRYVSTGDNAVFIGVNPDGSNYTTTGSAHLTFVYIGGAWRLMGVQE